MSMDLHDKIHTIRGMRVMLDADLAQIYGVRTKVLNQAVFRNIHRFPSDFMFRLRPEETSNLRSQFVTSSSRHGGKRYLPYAFTEHGAVMLAAVLKSPLAVEASIRIARAFVRLRLVLKGHKQLTSKIDELERRLDGHDEELSQVFAAIRQLMEPDPEEERPMGFQPP